MDDSAVRESMPTNYVRGLLMGTADAIPGVSGGTIALIVGIYQRLLDSLGHGFRAIIALVRFDFPGVRHHLGLVRWRLIVPLVAGIATAILLAARFMPVMLERYPAQSRSLFLGMVLASLAIPWSRIVDRSVRTVAVAVPAAVAAFVLTGLPPGTVEDPSLLQVFLTATVAICAMILPGVSGAFLLVVLGMYEPTLGALNDRDVGYVLVFVAGCVLGLGSFSIVLGSLLRRFHDVTMAALVGLMAGSLRALWPWQDIDRNLGGPPSTGATLIALCVAGAGFVAVYTLERYGNTAAPPVTAHD
jgi:putative membrane protein